MQEFLQARVGLKLLRPSTRLCFTLFLVFCLANYVVMSVMGVQRSGLTPASIAEYYAGAPGDEPKSTGALLEITHFHLFGMPLLLFVQGHVFLMTRWPTRLKYALVIAAFAGAACDLAAPWLVIHVARELAWIKIAGRVLLGPALFAFAVVPLWEMWAPQRRGGPAGTQG